ncbi:uncharacterized protein TNCV_670461 [Trichonephila clavipes]|nr:uncharacterized protein TNCV_670461 [Trichonephila clavipes]
MNNSQHWCINQVSASEAQTQQRSLNSSLGDTVGSPLVHLGGQLLNEIRLFASIIYGPWRTTFATSLILNSPILSCMVYFYHGGTRKVHKLCCLGNAFTLGPKANDHAILDVEQITPFMYYANDYVF